MEDRFWEERGQALEDAFFRQVDAKLLGQLRQQQALEAQKSALASCTGITSAALLDELVSQGIRSETIVALALVPLIRVAWADGFIEMKERNAVLQAAVNAGCQADSASYQLLDHWLRQPPSEEIFQTWKGYVGALSERLPPDAYSHLKFDLVRRANQVASAAGGLLGIGAVSAREKEAIDQIEQAFQ